MCVCVFMWATEGLTVLITAWMFKSAFNAPPQKGFCLDCSGTGGTYLSSYLSSGVHLGADLDEGRPLVQVSQQLHTDVLQHSLSLEEESVRECVRVLLCSTPPPVPHHHHHHHTHLGAVEARQQPPVGGAAVVHVPDLGQAVEVGVDRDVIALAQTRHHDLVMEVAQPVHRHPGVAGSTSPHWGGHELSRQGDRQL